MKLSSLIAICTSLLLLVSPTKQALLGKSLQWVCACTPPLAEQNAYRNNTRQRPPITEQVSNSPLSTPHDWALIEHHIPPGCKSKPLWTNESKSQNKNQSGSSSTPDRAIQRILTISYHFSDTTFHTDMKGGRGVIFLSFLLLHKRRQTSGKKYSENC